MEEQINYIEGIVYKRFLLFRYDRYYPGGGLQDATDFDTLEELFKNLKEGWKVDCIEVFDCLEKKEVDITAYGFEY